MSPTSALARRYFADARTRTISFALLFLFASAATVLGYRSAYPTRADRIEFARGIGNTTAVRLLYGVPHDLLTVGGYAGWRLVGSLTIFTALWGVLAAVRRCGRRRRAGDRSSSWPARSAAAPRSSPRWRRSRPGRSCSGSRCSSGS